MNLRRLPVLWILLTAFVVAAPAAPVWALCGTEEAGTCAGSPCETPDCPGEADPGGCALCGQFGKILVSRTVDPLQPVVSALRAFQGTPENPPEGVASAIDQPPRVA